MGTINSTADLLLADLHKIIALHIILFTYDVILMESTKVNTRIRPKLVHFINFK